MARTGPQRHRRGEKNKSKEDEEPYLKVAIDKLLFNYRALCWARNTEKFQFSDAFMDIL